MLNEDFSYHIFVEGLDNTGKSTQVAKIIKMFEKNKKNIHLLKYNALKGASKESQYCMSRTHYGEMFGILESFDCTNFILDRAHIGEYVYSPIYRGYDGDYVFEMEAEYINYTNLEYTKPVLLCFFDDPYNLMLREDGNSYSAKDNTAAELKFKISEINAFHNGFMISNIPNKIEINIKQKDVETVFKEIEKFLGEIK